MKHDFETWIEESYLPYESKELLDEAVVCFKASAYRASLLFSYLGFLSILRARLNKSDKPDTVSQERWDSIQSKIKDDEEWDSEVFDCTQSRTPNEVFVVDDKLRREVKYYKDKRNDCAHGRGSGIKHQHIEVFWSFIRKETPKFVVKGSRGEVIGAIRNHFDVRKTPKGEPYDHIVEEIPHAVQGNEVYNFMEDLHETFLELDLDLRPEYPLEELDFIDSILEIDEDWISEDVINFLKDNTNILVSFLSHHPEKSYIISGDEEYVRQIWYEHLTDTYVDINPVYCSLLRNDLIPEDQIDDSNERIANNIGDNIPGEKDIVTLKQNGFYEKFSEIAFEENKLNKFEWSNPKAKFIVHCIEECGMREDIARSIAEVFSQRHHPYDVRDALDKYLNSHEDVLEELVDHVESNDLPEPENLDSYQKDDEDDLPF